MQGQTAQKIFAFDKGDVWRHPGHCVNCVNLNQVWHDLPTLELYQRKGSIVFHMDLLEDEEKLILASVDAYKLQLIQI